MDVIISGFMIFINKFLGQAPLLLGSIVFIGYLLLGKKWYEALQGFIKTFVGFKILQVGTGGLVRTFRPIITNLSAKYGIDAFVIDPYFGQTSATEFLNTSNSLSFVGYVMLIAFIWNIILVAFRKQTKIRALFITGHIMYQQSAVLLWALYWVIEGTTGEPVSTALTVAVGLFLGTYWSVGSNLIIEPTQEVSEGSGFTVGHQQMFTTFLTYHLSKKIGNSDSDVNTINAPGFLSIFNDNIVANALIMTMFVGSIMVFIGAESFDYNRDKYFFATYIWETCAYFAVYITIVLTGVRLFVTELTNSFHGISNKLLKGAVPAVDCPVVFGFSPQGPMYGFIFGFFGQLIGILMLVAIGSPILLIAGFICLFFDNGTLAVYANKAGGRRAAAIIPFICGLIQVFGSAWVLQYLVGPPEVIGWMGMMDWATFFAGTTVLSSYLGIIVPIGLIPILLVIPQLQYRRYKETYFTTMRDQ
ncbi:MAG: PTS transporter subunit IIC [Anaeromicrobium sp.]|jgi:PTS system ascorbate-specific IIC component|uniref:PTS ascorbate transporter subunit IIC n=1 Tax=Anaeromicrobium sp. TaxID=1929132 RepID=UPI0025F6C731|nr:PTS ascorbate transporter subunit IIC [Anaeromicrobium sp.]MCT4594361.1 PTS transporter subunit IIC [Anaeromicrobium sp.]